MKSKMKSKMQLVILTYLVFTAFQAFAVKPGGNQPPPDFCLDCYYVRECSFFIWFCSWVPVCNPIPCSD